MFVPKYTVSEAFLSRLSQIDDANTFLRNLYFPRKKMEQLHQETLSRSVSLIVGSEDAEVGYGRVSRVLGESKNLPSRIDGTDQQIRAVHSIIQGIRRTGDTVDIVHQSNLKKCYESLEHMPGGMDIQGDGEESYRRSPKNILENTDKIIYSAAHYDQVPPLMDDLFDWLNYETKEVHPLLLAVIAYFQVLIVRPFLKNNGKMGWFLFLMVLKSHGYDFGDYVSLEKDIFVKSEDFYNTIVRLISTTYDSRNFSSSEFQPYILYLLPFLENTVKERVLHLEREHPRTMGEMLARAHLNERQKKALVYLLQNDQITNRAYLRLNGIKSRKLAWEELNQLIDEEILVKNGKGRNVSYIISSVLSKEAIGNHFENNMTTNWKQTGNN